MAVMAHCSTLLAAVQMQCATILSCLLHTVGLRSQTLIMQPVTSLHWSWTDKSGSDGKNRTIPRRTP